MTFTYAGQTFRIVFYHRHEPDEKWPRRCHPILFDFTDHPLIKAPQRGSLMVRAVTHCYIERHLDGKWRTNDRLMGVACCSLDDNFNKETGRKIALARCLRPCDPAFKKAAWEAYLGRLPKLEVDKTLEALRWLYEQVPDHIQTDPENSKHLDIVEDLLK